MGTSQTNRNARSHLVAFQKLNRVCVWRVEYAVWSTVVNAQTHQLSMENIIVINNRYTQAPTSHRFGPKGNFDDGF